MFITAVCLLLVMKVCNIVLGYMMAISVMINTVIVFLEVNDSALR